MQGKDGKKWEGRRARGREYNVNEDRRVAGGVRKCDILAIQHVGWFAPRSMEEGSETSGQGKYSLRWTFLLMSAT
jgi:hypothetical protein